MGMGTGTSPWVWVRGMGTRPWVWVRVRIQHVDESWVWVRVRVRAHRYGYGCGYAILHPVTVTGTDTASLDQGWIKFIPLSRINNDFNLDM